MELTDIEMFWRDQQPWLLSRGYKLRARYQPDWVPSWIIDPPADLFDYDLREDYAYHRLAPVLDAVRLVDNRPVMLKRVFQAWHKSDSEQAISTYFSSPELQNDPDNHCVPIYEVLEIPNNREYVIIVMPLLRPFDSPRFDTIGECLDFFYQIFKGLQFIHRHHVAHRDCTENNVMMDGSQLYPNGWHPVEPDRNPSFTGRAIQKYTRTQRPPKYYWTDFGLSVQFGEADKFPRAVSMRGGDKSVPEFQDWATVYTERDPFPTDIYYLGNLIRKTFTEGHESLVHGRKYGLDFMKPLIDAMVQDDMSKRPTIDQCVIHLEEIIRSQSSGTLRAQVRHSTDNIFGFIYRFIPYWARRIVYVITRTPAVPSWSRRSKSAPPSLRTVR